jgi:flagellar hook-associated protein 1 FlgK
MSINSALSIAAGGLANISADFALISQNVANAATPGYAVEIGSQKALTADGKGLGVQTGPARLQIDEALRSSVIQQNAVVSDGQTTQAALQAIDSVLGAPGAGTDLGSMLGKLRDSFSTLLTNPGSATQQSAVVSSATTLTQGINALSDAYTAQRQAAQNDIVSAVGTLNGTLATIGQLSNQIIALKPTNLGVADLENQRNQAVNTLSSLIEIKTTEQANGDLSIFTGSGLTLPIRGSGASPFNVPAAATPPGSSYPIGGIPGITLGGVDVTNQLVGGQIGADIKLRDNTLPAAQTTLDQFSYTLTSRFAAQGLDMFTDAAGNAPPGVAAQDPAGYIGYASTIQVSSAVAGAPSFVRDGTSRVPGLFTPNPSGGPLGFTTLIQNVLNTTFGSQSGGSLSDIATGLTTSLAQQSATVTSDLMADQALQTSLNGKLSSTSGVSMDTEMSLMLSLQNAYGANAKVITAAQSMFAALEQAIQ